MEINAKLCERQGYEDLFNQTERCGKPGKQIHIEHRIQHSDLYSNYSVNSPRDAQRNSEIPWSRSQSVLYNREASGNAFGFYQNGLKLHRYSHTPQESYDQTLGANYGYQHEIHSKFDNYYPTICEQEHGATTEISPKTVQLVNTRVKSEPTDINKETSTIVISENTPSSSQSIQDEGDNFQSEYKDPLAVPSHKDHDDKSAAKPSISYIALIGKAILQSSEKRLNLGSIYSWIEQNYPYYENRGQGWRNSVRHNLSLNDCFIKAGRCEDGKGNYWAIHPANLQDFLQGDYRQRRRSRRRGRKRDQEMHVHQMTNGLTTSSTSVSTSFPNTAALNPGLNSFYSPYTEAERRAYKLDEALRHQGMTTPFWNWMNSNNYSAVNNMTINSGIFGNTSTQWSTYPDNSHQSIFALNGSFSRHPV